MSKTFTKDDVAAHKTGSDLWIIVDDDVYDLTKFQDEHPGGKKILTRVAGKDASKQFWKYHNDGILKKYKGKLQIGSLEGKEWKQEEKPAEPKIEAEKKSPEEVKGRVLEPEQAGPGAVAPMPGEGAKIYSLEPLDQYGDMIPFADPSWYQGFPSPFYNQSHADLRDEVRTWMDEKVIPFCGDWEEEKRVPEEIYQEIGQKGWLAGMMGAHYPKDLVKNHNKTVAPDKWDQFHELIITDELSRCGSGGFVWNVLGGFGIGFPPVLRYAQKQVLERIAPDILNGEKRICLAITEPDAGSDVANLTCEAKLTEDGKHYIVNGEKKWITNGIWADYFTTAVRTGDKGMNGISVLLIERSFEGVSTRKMDCQGVWSSGTTYVTFEDVKVPVENLIGKQDKGFRVIMSNFNHERIGIIIQAIRFSRVCYEQAIRYAHKRETFGKKLIEHPVIRMKFADMARQIEAAYSWMETLIFQAGSMDEEEAMLRLGGAIAGCKAQSTKCLEFCAKEATQVFGGLAYSRGGQGGVVERLRRDASAYSIPGGSEEIMLDLFMRQSLKVHQVLGMKL